MTTNMTDDTDAVNEDGFMAMVNTLEKEEEVEIAATYDIYTYFINNVDTFLGRAIIKSILKDRPKP